VTPGEPRADGWTGRHIAILAGGLLGAVVLRLALLPTEGLRDDTDQFAGWIGHIATNGLPNAFDEEITFGPVIAYVWAALGWLEPGFRTATDASDAWLRTLIKLPPTLADFGLAAGVGYALRARPMLAVAGAIGILLHPAVWYVSSWWGQYESVYALAALVATLFAIGGRDGFAAAFLAVAILAKPQAVPLLLPFAAWFLARGGVAGLARAGLVGAATATVIWLPFLAQGGPLNYLAGIGALQDDVFSILSLRAWNLWWLVQEYGAEGNFASDRVSLVGPITLRLVGYALAAVLGLFVAYRVWLDARPRTLVLGLAAMTLVAFTFLTTMHERYAYAAVVFLMLLIGDARLRWLGVAFGATFTLNLVAAIPATAELGAVLPVSGWLGVAGSLAMLAVTVATLWALATPHPAERRIVATPGGRAVPLEEPGR